MIENFKDKNAIFAWTNSQNHVKNLYFRRYNQSITCFLWLYICLRGEKADRMKWYWKFCLASFLFCLNCHYIFSNVLIINNNRRSVYAVPASEKVKIDGLAMELFWKNAPIADNFIQYLPFNGNSVFRSTEVRLAYDNTALYVFAHLYDNTDSISYRLSKRDETNQADFFGILIDPFDDGLGSFAFFVTVAGVQLDAQINGSGDDYTWEAVWKSETKIVDDGWVVEMAIPYSALRFPKKEIQEWGVNFTRYITRYRERHYWNFVDVNIPGVHKQMGRLLGIQNVEPPLRLSLFPYFSAYYDRYKGESAYVVKGGADLKYGINESFTLDVMLIPDFGQVASDREVLNLGPYETYYIENRDFFKEGTELFKRADLFHSRRIGGRPVKYLRVPLDSTEILVDNPATVQLINATKLTGKTKNGFSLGLLNAVTAPSYATIEDTSTGIRRRWETQALTNQSVAVVEQSLPFNSYMSLINTNLVRADGYYANATGIDFYLERGKLHGLSGHAAYTYRDVEENGLGYIYRLNFSKIRGKLRYGLTHRTESEYFNPNDMGFSYVGNKNIEQLNIGYYQNKPWKNILNWRINLNYTYNTLADFSKFKSMYLGYSGMMTFNNYLSIGFNGTYKPVYGFDYDEPRIPGKKYRTPSSYDLTCWISTDYRKKIALDIQVGQWQSFDDDPWGYWGSISPRFSIGDKLLMILNFSNNYNIKDLGYVGIINQPDTIVFGRRDFKKTVTGIELNYILNPRSSLSLEVDHNWSRVEYFNFLRLEDDGRLTLLPDGQFSTPNINRNFFNLDLSYVWHFAPGSIVSLVWKNNLSTKTNNIDLSYSENVKNLFREQAQNSLSIRVIYYLDYQQLKGRS